MKLPTFLSKFADAAAAAAMAAAPDDALAKLRTVKTLAAMVCRSIPIPGAGLAVRRSPDGDIWSLTAEAKPFQISSTGIIHPGIVGGYMPTFGGTRLDEGPAPLTMSGTFVVWFELTFTVHYLNDFLSSYTLDSVIVDYGSAVPSDTDSVKYLQFNTITNGIPEASYFNTSISVALVDNGANDTLIHYGNF